MFPNPGPLETASLSLCELAFHGENKGVRDLLMRRHAYVDVCDSRGLTALHFATYNVHTDVVNLLLDFGANVNQFSDDALTALTIAFLLYYGNDPQLTINTALEHADPVVLNSRTSPAMDTARSQSKDRTMVQASRATTHSTRNFISRASTAAEDMKLPPSIELLKSQSPREENNALRLRAERCSSRTHRPRIVSYRRLFTD